MAAGQRRRAAAAGRPAYSDADIELLLCAARTTISSSAASRMRVLIQKGVDWDRLRLFAFSQGVGPLVGRTLRRTCPEAVPPVVLEAWQSQVHSSARRNLLLTGRLLRLVDALSTAGVRTIPFKGPALAAHAYGDLTLRPFVDIDVLVHKQDVAQATAVVKELGYNQRWRHPWEIEFQDESGVSVDLHWAIAPSYDPIPRTFDELWARVVPVTVLKVDIATLAAEDLLLVLSVQLAKDWREGRQRLLQICDTTELLRGDPELDWAHLLRAARAAGGERILLLDLLLAHDLLEAQVPEAVLRSAQENRAVRALARAFKVRAFPPGGPADRRVPDPRLASDSSALYVKARERMRDKIRYFGLRARDRIGLAVHPTQSDRAFLPLPAGLEFLYYLVRPARVLSHWIRTRRMGSNRERGSASPS